jgi:hypothetical protein
MLDRFQKAGVECLPNASMLGMGLITTRGADNSPMASWHPAPPELRDACNSLALIASRCGEHLEEVAIRWALENWAHAGSRFGSVAYPQQLLSEVRMDEGGSPARIGISVMGVSNVDELEETWALWKSVAGLANHVDERAAKRKDRINRIVTEQMWPKLGAWKDYSWQSGGEPYTNVRQAKGVVPIDAVSQRWGLIPKKYIDNAKI